MSAAALCCMTACKRDTPRQTTPTDSAIATSPPRTQPGQKSAYVGLQYDSLPADVALHAGAVIPRGTPGVNADYDLSHVTTPIGDEVWLDTLGAALGKGLRARIVRAELKVPPLAADERLFMASCDVNGTLDPRVVAIVVNQQGTSRFTRIRQAWRVNISQARFDVIPVAGVVCEDPGG